MEKGCLCLQQIQIAVDAMFWRQLRDDTKILKETMETQLQLWIPNKSNPMMARKREIQNEREIELERREEFSLSLPLWTTRPDLVEPMVLRFGFTMVLYSAVWEGVAFVKRCSLDFKFCVLNLGRTAPFLLCQVCHYFSQFLGWFGKNKTCQHGDVSTNGRN